MLNSIQHFVKNGIPQLEESQKNFMQDPAHLDQFVNQVKQMVLELGCHIVSETLEECNLMLEESIKRRIYWHIKDRTERTLLTSIGMVRFTHTRYTHKETKESAYLLDRILGLSAHTRLSMDAKACILEEAAQSNYRKAGEHLPESVSKETVMRNVHSFNIPKQEENRKEEKRQVKTLYVEADEDHIALQFHEKKGDIKCWKGHKDNQQIVKMVYVHEGIEKKEKRNQLKQPFFFGGIYPRKENEELWKEVDEYIKKTYDREKIEEIRFQSDGGGWMKKGVELLGGRFVLDGFHLRKYGKRMCRLAEKEEMEEELLTWIGRKQKGKVERWVKEAGGGLEERKQKKLEESWNYLKRNWKGVQERLEEKEENIGSSTEGHVSHILSARMSSRPMGWSRKGADRLAQLRIYLKNGRDVEKLLLGQKEEGEEKEEEKRYFSVHEILEWERRNQKKNGKYIEALQAKVSRQIGAKFYFHSAIAGIC